MRKSPKRGYKAIAICLGIACLMGLPLAKADIYKWVDEQGKVHYGDVPKGQAERLQRTGPGSDSETVPVQPQSDSGSQPPTLSKETPFAQGKSNATQEERCKEFRARVDRYKNAGDMFIDQPDGTRHKLADEERQKLIRRTQSQADEACSE